MKMRHAISFAPVGYDDVCLAKYARCLVDGISFLRGDCVLVRLEVEWGLQGYSDGVLVTRSIFLCVVSLFFFAFLSFIPSSISLGHCVVLLFVALDCFKPRRLLIQDVPVLSICPNAVSERRWGGDAGDRGLPLTGWR